MAIRVYETQESRTLRDGWEANQKSIELEFVAWDDNMADLDPTSVETAVLAVVDNPPYGNPLYGLYRQTILCRALHRHIFQVTVPYGLRDRTLTEIGFTTAGGTEHITHSLATVASYGATGFVAPNFNRAIGVVDGVPQGVQRPIPQLAFWVTRWVDPNAWTITQMQVVAELSMTWNLFDWNGFPAKSLLFEYAEAPSVKIGGTEPVPVKYYFKFKRPEVVAPGDGINFIKDPWDLVWFDTVRYDDQAAMAMSRRLRSAHREQIFFGSDFSLLGF